MFRNPLPEAPEAPEATAQIAIPPTITKKSISVARITADHFLREAKRSHGQIYAVRVSPFEEESSPTPELPPEYADFEDVFSKAKAEKLPEHKPYDHSIPLEEGKTPPFGPIYSLSAPEMGALKKYLDENLERGFIQPSQSPAGAPILFVKKKDGSLRLCVDYRGLNNVTIKNRYPLPLISQMIDAIGGSLFFTTIDLRGAYNLLRIRKGEEWKTAFRCRYGHYEYRVMPFGLCNAPGTFQGLMNDTLHEYLDKFCQVYLDDILIYSKTKEEHIQHVRLVLEKLRATGLYAKLEKCRFSQPRVDFLGFVLAREGVSMDPSKLEPIQTWPTPKSVRDVQSFLGFANFYRRFI
jgi:hypothetical protein